MAQAIQNFVRKRRPIERVTLPFQEFFKTESTSGILLIVAIIFAMIWANSPWADTYFSIWQTKMTFAIGSFEISKSLLLWINDGLMAIFFFVVGLEIKREFLVGELSSIRQAALPIAAAMGGMIVPATIFLLINLGQDTAQGWGVAMATDIAFALGILSLLGNRVPTSLKVFLTAIAIVDDIGAVLVIALFYTESIALNMLLGGLGIFLLLVILNRLGVRNVVIYLALGLLMWVFFLKSGVHATIASILLAFTIPAFSVLDQEDFIEKARNYVQWFEEAKGEGRVILTNRRQKGLLNAMEDLIEKSSTPLQRLEHNLHPMVAYLIMPLFAFANAGVVLGSDLSSVFTTPVAIGVFFGLVLGKQIGVFVFARLAVALGLANKPESFSWTYVYGAGLLAGIGFTMSIFIANLAFNDPAILQYAKLGILGASLLSGIAGWLVLRNAKTVEVAEQEYSETQYVA